MPAHSGDIKGAISHDDAAIVLISDHACTRRGKSADNGVLLLHVCVMQPVPRVYGAYILRESCAEYVCGRGLFIIYLNYCCCSEIRIIYTVL